MRNLEEQQQQIIAQLEKLACQESWRVEVYDSLSSTNTYLLQQSGVSSIHARICMAHHQSAGRGRLGRNWRSDGATTLMFSVGWRNEPLRPLSIIVGYALLQALHGVGVQGVSLKWPNDVLLNGAKLAGILVETRASQAVVGVGVNLAGARALSAKLARPVADLSAYDFDMFYLVAIICRQIEKVVEQFDAIGAERFVAAWNAWHAYHRRDVWLLETDRKTPASVMSLAPDGGLIVKQNGREVVVGAGEVSLRA